MLLAQSATEDYIRASLIADAATGVEDFYSLKQIQTVIRPRSYPLLCQFLMKIIIVINLVCACVKTSPEDDDFKSLSKGERESVCVFYIFELLRCYVCTIQFLLLFYYEIERQP